MLGLFRRKPHERAGFELYTAAVAAARQPWFYTELGAPDTLDGRFDVISLHVVLLIERLRRLPAPGAALGQAVFDAMFADMDRTLREIGVSDMTVGRKVRAMWEALHGRSSAYVPALGDEAALAAALRHNVWRGGGTEPGARQLAAYAVEVVAALDKQELGDFEAGHASFPPVSRAQAA